MSKQLNRTRELVPRLLAPAIITIGIAVLTLSVTGMPAQAQTPVDHAPVPHHLPSTSPLVPADLEVGDQFRLLHLTNHQLDVSPQAPPGYYNGLVMNDAGRHPETYHPFLRAQYRVVASDANATARENTATSGTGVPIYWLNGERVADDYHDFYDGDWDSVAATDNLGRPHPNPSAIVWTGSTGNGEPVEGQRIGDDSVAYGNLQSAGELQAGTMAAGVGEFYAISPVFTVVNPEDIVQPAKPTGVTAVAGPREINVSWEPSEGATGYWVQRRAPGGQFSYDRTMRVTTATQYVDDDVEPGQEYDYQVHAHSNGTLSKCCAPPVSVGAPDLPARVKGLRTRPVAADDGTETIMLSWRHVTDSDYPVIGYLIRRSARRDAGWQDTQEIRFTLLRGVPPADRNGRVSYTDHGAQVSSEVEYRYQVKALSAVGLSRRWSKAVVSLDDYRPAQVEGLTATQAGDGGLRFSWHEPDDHGHAIKGYEPAYRYGNSGNYHRMRRHQSSDTELTTDAMVPGAVVHFRVRATNRYGRGPWSEPVAAVVPGVMVAEQWKAAPAGLEPGDSFRLMFVTSGSRSATERSISAYNSRVSEHAAENRRLEPYADDFRALASAGSVNAFDNTETHHHYGGVPVYWVDGHRIADDYHDLYDGSWANVAATDENGNAVRNNQVWTGSQFDGSHYPSFSLGHSQARVGFVQSGATGEEISGQALEANQRRPVYGLSPVFTIATPPAEPEQD